MMVLRLTSPAVRGQRPASVRQLGHPRARERDRGAHHLRREYAVNQYGVDPDVTWILDRS